MLCYVGYFFVSASDEMNQIPVICIHLLVFLMPSTLKNNHTARDVHAIRVVGQFFTWILPESMGGRKQANQKKQRNSNHTVDGRTPAKKLGWC